MTVMPGPSEAAQPFEVLRFAGLKFTPLEVDAVVQALAARPADMPFAAFVTPNAEHAFLRRQDPEFRAAGDDCWLSVNDSRVLRQAARLAGLELKFAPGAYVVDELLKVIGKDEPVSVIGATPDVVADLKAQFGLRNITQHIPPMGFIRNEAAVKDAIDFVAAHPARFVFVAMGPPQSEKFCQRVIADGRSTGIGLCIGSSLTMSTGHAARAPDVMETTGLVWLYRLAKEPRRLWKRYLVRGMVGLGVGVRDIVSYRLTGKPARDLPRDVSRDVSRDV